MSFSFLIGNCPCLHQSDDDDLMMMPIAMRLQIKLFTWFDACTYVCRLLVQQFIITLLTKFKSTSTLRMTLMAMFNCSIYAIKRQLSANIESHIFVHS